MVRIVINIEGGGDNKTLQIELRRAFSKLFERAGFSGRMPSVDCSGSRNQAFKDFATSRKRSNVHALLLVDAEGGVAPGAPAWQDLKQRDGWSLDASVADDVHLMVQVMESWFLADRAALAQVFNPGFKPQHLPGSEHDVEPIPKDDVEAGLASATRQSAAGVYDRRTKGRLGPRILAALDPGKLKRASPHAKRFFDRLEQLA